jgi:hypothetical protein
MYTPSLAHPYPYQSTSDPSGGDGPDNPLIGSLFAPHPDTTVGDGSVYLTPEALMVYCQSRLQDIDSQVETDMNKQSNINWEQQQIGDLMTEVTQLQSTENNGIMDNKDSAQKLEQDIETKIAEIQQRDPGSPVLSQLEQLHDTVMATGTGPYTDANGQFHGYYNGSLSKPGDPPSGQNPPDGVNTGTDGKFGDDELHNWASTLQSINSTLNNSAEMGMIDIQSKMSLRSTAIQLSTNILQSVDDGASKIAANVGRAG